MYIKKQIFKKINGKKSHAHGSRHKIEVAVLLKSTNSTWHLIKIPAALYAEKQANLKIHPEIQKTLES